MDIKRARVVVVEDEAVMSTFILNSLRRLGILDLWHSPMAPVPFANWLKLKPDLILTDVHMQPLGASIL